MNALVETKESTAVAEAVASAARAAASVQRQYNWFEVKANRLVTIDMSKSYVQMKDAFRNCHATEVELWGINSRSQRVLLEQKRKW